MCRYKERFFSQEHFYNWSAAGTLPAFSWVHPPIQACDHPCQDVAKGERLLKDVYEALRASPKWTQHGQSGRLGGARSGQCGLVRPHPKA